MRRRERLAGDAFQLAVAEPNVPVQIDALAIQGRPRTCAARPASVKRLATACAIGLDSRSRTPLPGSCASAAASTCARGAMLAASCYGRRWRSPRSCAPRQGRRGLQGLSRGGARLGNELGRRRWAERARAEAREFDQAKTRRGQLEAFFSRRARNRRRGGSRPV
jgi:hypothetical protein